MKAATKRKLYRRAFFFVAIYCLSVALAEWFFGIPFRHKYFPAETDRFETLRPMGLSVLALLCMVESCALVIYRRIKST